MDSHSLRLFLALADNLHFGRTSREQHVSPSALSRSIKQLEDERNGTTPSSKALTPEQQKIQELEARINRLEREKAILKKATALLMSEEFERMR